MRNLSAPWATILAVLAVGLMSCTEEGGQARTSVEVLSLNGNQPLLSDVYNFGRNTAADARDDDFIPVDIVEVTLANRPPEDAQGTMGPGGPMGAVSFNRYDVVFGNGDHPGGADLDGDGTVDLANFGGPMHAVVPLHETDQAFVLVVDGTSKVNRPLVCLGPYGGCNADVSEFKVNAKLTFYGTEDTSGYEVVASRNLTIRIGQFGDE